MAVVQLPLSDFGLLTVAGAALALDKSVSTVQKWVQAGRLPVVVVGSGRSAVYLLRAVDVTLFNPPAQGRRVGSKDKKPRKPRSTTR